jgi:hypothetical protein
MRLGDRIERLGVQSYSRRTKIAKDSLILLAYRPGMLMLAGGLPSPAYCASSLPPLARPKLTAHSRPAVPFESLSGQALIPNSYKTSESSFAWIKSFFESKAPKTTTFTIPKYADDAQAVQLSTALQYGELSFPSPFARSRSKLTRHLGVGTATGLPSLTKFIHDFTAKVYDPGYSNWEVLINAGSTDAWSKICTTLLERGDGILCEEWTYPSALAVSRAPVRLSRLPWLIKLLTVDRLALWLPTRTPPYGRRRNDRRRSRGVARQLGSRSSRWHAQVICSSTPFPYNLTDSLSMYRPRLL